MAIDNIATAFTGPVLWGPNLWSEAMTAPPPQLTTRYGKLRTPEERSPKPKRHVCAPPTDTILPSVGVSWDCPLCGKVWIVKLTQDVNGSVFSRWHRASWWVARQHMRSLA